MNSAFPPELVKLAEATEEPKFMCEDIHETPSSTPNFKTELAKQLQELVPEAVADGKIDVTKLSELLGDDVDDTSERFGLFWPGKLRAIRAAQEPTTATLTPEPDLSKDWDDTKNVFIEGDNLEALKILQKHYHGRIKMIYIDPPYNTGKDFVYPDNYREGLKTYLEWTKQVNEEGQKVKSNSESDGRYHSRWLNMMYPRLKLARNLLSEDGVIFISIDDSEQDNLKKVCNEIFGESNFIAELIWQRAFSPKNDAKYVSTSHDYILMYARSSAAFKIGKLPRTQEADARYSNPDNDPRGPWMSDNLSVKTYSTANDYPITTPSGRIVNPPSSRCWVLSRASFEERAKDNRIWFGADGDGVPRIKRFLSELKSSGMVPTSILTYQEVGHSQEGAQEVVKLFEGKGFFDSPKPTRLLDHLIRIANMRNKDFMLDFFAGSGSTFDAAFQMNTENNSDLKIIGVQLPEPVSPDSPAGKAGFRTIADISRKRIDLAGEKIKKDYAEQLAKRDTPLDVGYRTFKLTDTNFTKWRETSAADQDALERHLFEMRDSADDDSTELALLTEVLLKQGYSLSEPVREETIGGGVTIWSVADGLVLAYMNEHVKPTLEQLRELVNREPEKLIILEDAFQGDDELKTNLAQAAKTKHVELWTA